MLSCLPSPAMRIKNLASHCEASFAWTHAVIAFAIRLAKDSWRSVSLRSHLIHANPICYPLSADIRGEQQRKSKINMSQHHKPARQLDY